MLKAIILITGVSIYMYFLQLGHAAATQGLANTQNLYTHSIDHPDAILSSNR